MAQPRQYILEPIMSFKEAEALEGEFIDESHYHTLINSDADVYWNDDGKQKLLFHFRKNIIPDAMLIWLKQNKFLKK